jgi:hypothetical protein
MTHKSFAIIVYLQCLAFLITTLLAVSGARAEGGSNEETSDMVEGGAKASYNNNTVCYDSK